MELPSPTKVSYDLWLNFLLTGTMYSVQKAFNI